MSSKRWMMALLAAVCVCSGGLCVATDVGGTYSTNQNWTLGGSPYIATSTVTIASAATLTIDPGVTVKFNTGTGLVINGKRTAIGTAGSLITFTSSAATPAPGNWKDIQFLSGSNPASRISYATISYGGATNNRNLYITSSSPMIDHVTVSYSSKDGIRVAGNAAPTLDQVTVTNCGSDGMMISGSSATPVVTNSTFSNNVQEGIDIQSGGGINLSNTSFTNNTSYGIKTVAGTRLNGLTGLAFSGNGGGAKDGIQHAGGTISANETWRAGATWFVATNTTVAATWSLTIDPGTTIKFSTNTELSILGKLTAIGTPESPIIFTTAAATPAPGGWRRVGFGSGSSSASRLAYATISYGGAYYSNLLNVTSSTPIIDHVTVSYSSVRGIRVTTASPVLDQVTVTNCTDDGMVIDGASSNVTVTNSTFSNNGGEGIEVATNATLNLTNSSILSNTSYAINSVDDSHLNGMTGLTLTGNGGGLKDGVLRNGGTIDSNEIWRAGAVWFVTATPTIASAASLTIEPGTIIKFSSATQLTVSGKLVAAGTAVAPIVFTTAAATPSPGGWKGIVFQSGANPLSQVSYVTVSYAGGSSAAGALQLSGFSTGMDHVSVSYSAAAGLYMSGASNSSATQSAFNNNNTFGIRVAAGAALTLTDSTITNNGSYAIAALANARLNGLTGLTVTGNGGGTGDAIDYEGGTITTAEIWGGPLPWIVKQDTTIQAGVTLTIQPATTLKFAAAKRLTVSGKLTAVGTAGAPILFTAESSSPAPGAWTSVAFVSGSDSTSRIAYATVSYGGNATYGANVYVNNVSPSFDHVTFSNSGAKGVVAAGTAPAPSFQNCSFIGNATGGLQNSTPASIVDARLNYWGAASGPSGSGPGSGQSVSTGVKFEPWLTASYTDPQFINSVFVGNRTSNPTAGISLNLNFTTTLSGDWKVTIFDSGSTAIRTIPGSGSTANVSWDGKNDAGVVQPNGNYSYQLESTAPGPLAAAPAKGPTIIDHSLLLIITGPTASQAYFSPNGNGIQDTNTITASFTFDGASWTLNFRNAVNDIVRTATGVAGSIAYVWDGKDGTGAVAADGLYTAELIVTDGPNTANASTTTTLDNTYPVAVLTSPTNSQILSNVYQDGETDVPFVGTASDLNLSAWAVQTWTGTNWVDLWSYGCTGTSPVVNSTLCVVRTDEFSNGTKSLRLTATDRAGNTSSPAQTNAVSNFAITQNVLEINPTVGQTVNYTSTVPFPVTETLVVKSQSGQIVRTIQNAVARNAGAFVDNWNGKNDSAAYIPDGPYFFYATVTDGTHTITYDLSTKYWNNHYGSGAHNICSSDIDPLHNKPYSCSYTTGYPAQVKLIVSPLATPPENCSPPSFCLIDNEYRSSAANKWFWSGLDSANVYRGDIQSMRVVHSRAFFAKNAIILYGTMPIITIPTSGVPTDVRSGAANQIVSLDFTTFQSQPAAVKFEFKNLESNSTLRSVILNAQPPGHVVWAWDGRAGNGMPVAPGRYVIIGSVTDPIGNVVSSDILIRVEE